MDKDRSEDPDDEVLDPGLRIIDAHHHLWLSHEPWAPYGLDQLRADICSGHNVVSSVFVESNSSWRTEGPTALRPVGETEWVAGVVDGSPLVGGIVGFADLSLGDAVAEVLEAHLDAGRSLFRGIRHGVAWDASPDIPDNPNDPGPHLLSHPAFRRGLQVVQHMGLTFDAWLYFPQIPELTAVADALPDLGIVLNHLGGLVALGPYKENRHEVFSVSRGLLAELARRENVVVKLGGIGMPMYNWEPETRDDSVAERLARTWGPFIRWCVETFGPDRCMCESNFPVDKQTVSYRTLWNVLKQTLCDLSETERRAVFHDTAARFYRLQIDEGESLEPDGRGPTTSTPHHWRNDAGTA
jgi:predicted TIM-barrel fold metal-dependent hydrolase